MVRVVHLSTTHSGGAGIAARALNQMLRRTGTYSFFASNAASSYVPSQFESSISIPLLIKLENKVFSLINLSLGQPFFSLMATSRAPKLDSEVLSENSILHFHNFYNLFDRSAIVQNLYPERARFVTLHDERMYTRGCHYSLDCSNFLQSCSRCLRVPRLFNSLMEEDLSIHEMRGGGPALTFIAPSRWIMQRFQASSFGRTANVVHIPNVLNFLDVRDYGPRMRSKKIVVGYAGGIAQWIKGSRLWSTVVESVRQSSSIHAVTPEDYRFDMRAFLKNIDILCVPSSVDNHPNVISEAHLEGVPVIAHDVGGISEMVFDGYDSLLPAKASITEWIDAIYAVARQYDYIQGLEVRMKVQEIMTKALGHHISLYQNSVAATEEKH